MDLAEIFFPIMDLAKIMMVHDYAQNMIALSSQTGNGMIDDWLMVGHLEQFQ